jgi:hypothetical protein
MALDLDAIAAPKRFVVPVLEGSFLLDHKNYRVKCDDGWQVVEIQNNKAKWIEQGGPIVALGANDSGNIRGYTHHNRIIFQNFDVARRKYGLGLQSPLHFNQSQTFESIHACIWEDGQAYWVAPNYSDTKVFELKDLLEEDKTLDGVKGITPELRTLYLNHALERAQLKQLAEEAQRQEDHERMLRDIPYRLQHTFARAGAEMVNFSLSGTRIVVDWKIKGSHTQYNSVIDSGTWMVVEAGYCMSGDDRRHNITSMVKTAEAWGRTNITRFHGDDERVRGPHMDREVEDDEDWD